ncbi:DHS-like NAD/FAD-binding domain-containing protein [Daedalea quercina L-15889]|uniref:DHS-like NAD/FAD-binding domain-containing protein n=1 Tax=Daedalea quercina L-15889 TaxID=1314783 RepID=A0A165T3U0_9APHY|nr:DHS-like NAD/FAD-binding domain-containing protein [Daedalea quercina L-15889]
MPPSEDPQEFREVLRQSKNIIAIAGAGLSAGSGIPTWRDTGGVWKTHNPATLATPAAFSADPIAVWRHYHEMRERALKAEPNPAHYALSLLCLPSYLATVAPSAKFTLITQNIDGLSIRALKKTVARSRGQAVAPGALDATVSLGSCVFEMHGRVLDTLCTACGHVEHNDASPLCPALANPVPQVTDTTLTVDDLPHCAHCGGLLRPGVVWFDELPRHSREIWGTVDEADLCLVIGTSSTVQPAVAYVHEVAEHGGKVAVFNTQRGDDDDESCTFLFLGPCEETLPRTLFDISVSQ